MIQEQITIADNEDFDAVFSGYQPR